jgi:uncharacterized protein (TIGR02118 family)
MVKLIALYRKPADPDAFLKHYREVHTPLMRKVPGMSGMELKRVTANPFGGEPAYFLVAEMTWPDQAAFKTAMKSPENAAAGKDLVGFAKGLVDLLVAEVE